MDKTAQSSREGVYTFDEANIEAYAVYLRRSGYTAKQASEERAAITGFRIWIMAGCPDKPGFMPGD